MHNWIEIYKITYFLTDFAIVVFVAIIKIWHLRFRQKTYITLVLGEQIYNIIIDPENNSPPNL